MSRRFLSGLALVASLAIPGCGFLTGLDGAAGSSRIQTLDVVPIDAVQGQSGVHVHVYLENLSSVPETVPAIEFRTYDSEGVERTSEYSLAGVEIPSELSPNRVTELGYDITVSEGAATGVVEVKAYLLDDYASDSLTVLRAAQLVLQSEVVEGPTCRGTTATVMTAVVRNEGDSPAVIGSAGLLLWRADRDITSEFDILPHESLPITVAPGQLATLSFHLLALLDGTAGPARAVLTLLAKDERTNQLCFLDRGAKPPAEFEVHTPAALAVTFLEIVDTLAPGDAFSATVNVDNTGTVPLEVNEVIFNMDTGVTNVTDDYAVTSEPLLPVVVPSGQSASLPYVLTFSAAASQLGPTGAQAAVAGFDSICARDTLDFSPDAGAGWTSQ